MARGRYAPLVRLWLAVALGGALGALGRWIVGEAVVGWIGAGPTFPWGTLLVNVVGCALIGVVAPLVIGRSRWIAGFAVTGFLGGFTTYSAFAEETFALADRGDTTGLLLAAVYVLTTISVTTAAVALGSRLGPGSREAVAS